MTWTLCRRRWWRWPTCRNKWCRHRWNECCEMLAWTIWDYPQCDCKTCQFAWGFLHYHCWHPMVGWSPLYKKDETWLLMIWKHLGIEPPQHQENATTRNLTWTWRCWEMMAVMHAGTYQPQGTWVVQNSWQELRFGWSCEGLQPQGSWPWNLCALSIHIYDLLMYNNNSGRCFVLLSAISRTMIFINKFEILTNILMFGKLCLRNSYASQFILCISLCLTGLACHGFTKFIKMRWRGTTCSSVRALAMQINKYYGTTGWSATATLNMQLDNLCWFTLRWGVICGLVGPEHISQSVQAEWQDVEEVLFERS